MPTIELSAMTWRFAILCLSISCAVEADEDALDTSDGEIVAAPCSQAKRDEVLAPATTPGQAVTVNCTLTLPPNRVVTKRLLFEGAAASGQTFDCAGGLLDGGAGTVNAGRLMIEIRSRRFIDPETSRPAWQRPETVTVRNCRVVGAVRIWGMAINGEGVELRDSSRLPGHVARARSNAPRNIVLDHLTITGTGTIPLYLSPGVSGVQLRDSTIDGTTRSVAVYLDAESTGNTLRNNAIHPTTDRRELIAVDGSSNNTIVNNDFSSLAHGGIYLYRNCGEGGTIRISTPSNNAIINNTFYYDHYTGDNPSIYVASRDGNPFPYLDRFYCGDDAGYPYGSSASDLDFARNNGVVQNQIVVRSVSDMIQTRNVVVNSPNLVGGNQSVTAIASRPAGCYLPNGYGQKFLPDGGSVEVLLGRDGKPSCDGKRYTCHDGALTSAAVTGQACAFTAVPFDCEASSTNSGCTRTVACPSGKTIVGAYGACNLESTSLTTPTPSNTLRVVEPSDITSDGHCVVDGHDLAEGAAFLTGLAGKPAVSVGCREFDLFGGDCHIQGAIYCR